MTNEDIRGHNYVKFEALPFDCLSVSMNCLELSQVCKVIKFFGIFLYAFFGGRSFMVVKFL